MAKFLYKGELEFIFYWSETGQWEGVNYTVLSEQV